MSTPGFLASRLARRIVAYMILASAALSLLAAAVQLYSSYRSDLERVMTELDVVETSFLSGLENALWQFNAPQVNVLIEGIYAQADIAAVTLTSQTGEVFNLGEAGSESAVVREFELIHTRDDGRTTEVGLLQVTLSLKAVQERLRSQFLTLLASNFAKTLAASAIMLFIFDRMISTHLRSISAFVSRPGWDREDDILSLDRPEGPVDDLSRITGALNASRERIQATRLEREALSTSFETILNASTSGIIAFDADGRIALMNPRVRHMLGQSEDKTPMSWPDEVVFLDPEDMSALDDARNPVERVLAGQTLKNEVAVMTRTKAKDPRYVRLSSAKLDASNALGLQVMLVIDDVSEQEKNRQQVERASRLDALGQLTGGVAHDFNNLLATISYGMELARTTEDEAKREKYLDAARSSIERGTALTKRLLAFAKRQPGQAESRRVGEVLQEFHDLARPTIEETIDLQIQSDLDDILVYCDIAQLENALLNLVINSRDSILRSGTGGKIMIQARAVEEIDGELGAQHDGMTSTNVDQGYGGDTPGDAPPEHSGQFVEISITDDGPGMDEEVRRRATDPFFTTKATNSGTGLGLSMVYGFVQQSYGRLRIYSEVGQGTTVRMFLRRGVSVEEKDEAVEFIHRAEAGGQTILIVEDEPYLLEVISDMVASFGYRVILAERGNTALDLLQSEQKIDCLLTDVIMPGGIGGFELARRAREVRPDIPVLYMSGYAGFSDEEMGRIVAPMINKPSSPYELSRALQGVIRATEGAPVAAG